MRNTFVSAFTCLALVAGCGKSDKPAPGGSDTGATPATGGAVGLTGAGATFPYPLYGKWIAEYQKATPGVTINYQSIGSGGGVKQVIAKTVDFGASDVPMSDEELGKAGAPILHIPTTLGAVVIAYNLPSVKEPLKLTPDAIAGIYLGDIKNWNDPKIAESNPGVTLPGDAISVAFRADGSGTTGVFTNYLAAVSPVWKDKVGAGKSVAFPAGSGAKGNEGVAGVVKGTPGSLGYVELAYAKQNGIAFAQVKNANGEFVTASTESVTAAAAGSLAAIPADYRTSIVNPPGAGAYPIAAFTYLLLYQNLDDAAKAKAIAQYVWWALHDGQKLCAPLDYAPLPAELVTKLEATLRTLTAAGQPALPKA